MVWARTSDNCDSHPKVMRLSHLAYRVWCVARNYSCQHLTDGVLDDGALVYIRGVCTATKDEVDAAVEELLVVPLGFRHGLFERTAKGLLIHDFLDFNPPRARVLADRKRRSESGKLGARKTNELKRLAADAASSDAAPDAADAAAPAAAHDAATDAAHASRARPSAAPGPARPGHSMAGGRDGSVRTTPAAATAPPSSDGPQRAPSSGGARQAEVRGEGHMPPVLRGRPLTLAETVARAELLDPSRMRKARDSGADVEAEACRILHEHAAPTAQTPASAQLDRDAASSAIAGVKRRATAAATRTTTATPDDDPDERKAIAEEARTDFDLDAGDQPGENRTP